MTSTLKPSPRVLPALLLTGLLATLAGCGVAQSAPSDANAANATMSSHATSGMKGHGEGMRGHDPARMQARMNQRMTELKTQLKITPAQEAAWSSFSAAMQPTQGAGYAGMRAKHEELSKLPTPERLDRMRALHTEHMAEMNTRMTQRADATKAFYNVLSPEQKKVFDDAFTRGMNGRRGHHMMGGDGQRMGSHGDHRS